MCNCIDDVVKEVYDDEDIDVTHVDLKLSKLLAIKDGKTFGQYKTGQAIRYEYKKQLRNGKTKIEVVNTFIAHEFCPFCGVKYNS